MKTLQFKILGKRVKLEETGNPHYFKMIIDTTESFRCKSFYAINVRDAIYFSVANALGGK